MSLWLVSQLLMGQNDTPNRVGYNTAMPVYQKPHLDAGRTKRLSEDAEEVKKGRERGGGMEHTLFGGAEPLYRSKEDDAGD